MSFHLQQNLPLTHMPDLEQQGFCLNPYSILTVFEQKCIHRELIKNPEFLQKINKSSTTLLDWS